MITTIDFKNTIKKYNPSFFIFIPESDTFWNKINIEFNKITVELEVSINKGVGVSYSCYHNFIFAAEIKNEPDKKGFLELIEFCLAPLSLKIIGVRRSQFRKQILYKILTAKGDNFFNHCAELFSLFKMLQLTEYELDAIEFKLPNGKQTDFALINKEFKEEKGKGILVEIVNMHHDGTKSDEYLKTWINDKIQTKLNSELKSLEIADWNYLLQPIIWCWEHNNLEQLKRIEKDLAFPNNVLAFCTVVKIKTSEKESYLFGSLSLVDIK